MLNHAGKRLSNVQPRREEISNAQLRLKETSSVQASQARDFFCLQLNKNDLTFNIQSEV